MNDLIEEVDETQPNNTTYLKESTLQGSKKKQSDSKIETSFNEISQEEREQFKLSLFEKDEENKT